MNTRTDTAHDRPNVYQSHSTGLLTVRVSDVPDDVIAELSTVSSHTGRLIRKAFTKNRHKLHSKDRRIAFYRSVGQKTGLGVRSVHLIVSQRYWQHLKRVVRSPDTTNDQNVVRPMFSSSTRTRSAANQRKPSLSPASLVRSGQLFVDERNWQSITQTYTREEVIAALIAAIREYKIPAPITIITQRDADLAFERARSAPTRPYLKRYPFYTKMTYSERYPLSDMYVEAQPKLNPASGFYHNDRRYRVSDRSHSSILDAWDDDNTLATTLASLWTLKVPAINKATLRSCLTLRLYAASQFPVLTAKTIYDMFNSRRVYDPSSGWGDRLAGFMAARGTEEYYSTDPNRDLYAGYKQQAQRYRGDKRVRMFCTGAEFPILREHGIKVDTVFTSPPYFDAERYSDDDSQSFKKFGTEDAWLDGFLFKMIANAWAVLDNGGDRKRGGILALNISDITATNNTQMKLCDPMNDFISRLPGARYIGCIGMHLSGARVGANGANLKAAAAAAAAAAAEPIWLWAKGGTYELDDYVKHGWSLSRPKSTLFCT